MIGTILSTRFLATAVVLAGIWALPARGAEAPYASWGQELYMSHCAACHGASGAGDGPAAVSLKTAPSDLTVISMAHEGKFPGAFVTKFIGGEFRSGVHGSREMPVWGEVFRQQEAQPYGTAAVRARIHALTDYLRSIQRTKK